MRVVRILALMALLLVGVAASARSVDAQNNNNSFKNFIDALNTGDQANVMSHLSSSFTLTFTGGTSVTGAEAVQMLMLLDRPIAIDSVMPGGMQKGSAKLTFGSGQQYSVDFTGARGGNLATMTIGDPTITN